MNIELDARPAYAYTGGKPFDASLPCVVLIHGALNDHSVWALQSRYLAHHGHAVLAVDLPGHGRSAGPACERVEDAAQWVVSLLKAAGVSRAALVGHSMGSLIALEAAAQLGDQASALVMVATAFPMKVSPAMLELSLKDPVAAMHMVNAFSNSTLAAKPSSPGPGAWLRGGGMALMQRLQQRYAQAGHGNLFHRDFTACDRYEGALAAAAKVTCPAHLVLGAKDAMTIPKAAAPLGEALRARVHTLGAGHSLMGEAPDGVLNALKAALAAA